MGPYLKEFKERNQILHSSDDDSIKEQLNDSFEDIRTLIGDFDPRVYRKGKGLVFERTRYVRNEALEYFYPNFQQSIMDASINISGGKGLGNTPWL